ncbi:MAG TPA: septum formation initiator family protein [Acidimicrobiales bacterium]
MILRPPRLPRAVWLVVGSTILAAVLLLGVFPTRSYLSQRDAIDREKTKVAVLDRENQRLAARVTELQTDAEIERLAREQYNLVKPGEEAYAILPAPEDAETGHRDLPPPPPDPSFWEQVVDTVTFWN